jgi:serine/threonine-protein kinase
MADAPRYHAVRKIADGGSAEVFLGEQQGAAGFRRPVVLKRIRPALYADEQFREMLVEEAHLAMSLHHPNLVEVLDLGESNGSYFLVLELIDGWTLGTVARRGRAVGLPMPPELCVYVGAEICRGLGYAHQRKRDGVPLGVVHRDICPNNVLVSMHADVKVTDFGIARASTRTDHTRSGMIRGKPMYMSPEQARGEPLDARSDLFSVGTVLYSLLTGQLPFPGPSDREYLAQIANTDAPSPGVLRPDLPKELCRLVQKAMARKREDRFATAQEMLFALEHVQRTALKPAGRSELEAWLRALSAKDGELAITRQTMPPAPVVDEPEWISLSAQQAILDDQTATQRAVPTFAAPQPERSPRPARWPLVLFAAVLVAGSAAWWLTQPPGPSEGAVDAGVAPVLTVAPEQAIDAGPAPSVATPPDTDAGEVATTTSEPEPPDTDEADAAPTEPAVAAPTRVEPPSRSGTARLKLSARLAPNQKPGDPRVGVVLDSTPPGVVIRVDKRELGRTPATLHFRAGLTFDVWFEAPGQPPLRQWLIITERAGKLPKVTLRAPVDAP